MRRMGCTEAQLIGIKQSVARRLGSRLCTSGALGPGPRAIPGQGCLGPIQGHFPEIVLCCDTVAIRRPCIGPGYPSPSTRPQSAGTGAAGVRIKMPQLPESTSSSIAVSRAHLPEHAAGTVPGSSSGAQAAAAAPQRIPRWLERMELFLRVILRMYIGLAVCYAPWSHTFWDQNPLFLQFPTLSIYAAHGAVRGIVSGVGLLNLWIAIQDVIRHRDE
jgi:hypothetical protein